jgi:hypothetical protein
LVDFGKPAPGQSQQHLWYNNPELAMSASSAGSYLIDMLHMRVLHLSPLAISAPEAFLEACTGVPPFFTLSVVMIQTPSALNDSQVLHLLSCIVMQWL